MLKQQEIELIEWMDYQVLINAKSRTNQTYSV